jgi:aspartate racemase
MRSVGIIGGIGPESTVEYYRLMIAAYRERRPDGSAPSIIINSIDLRKMLALIAANQLVEVTVYLVDEVEKLARAGAEIGLLAANTPHIVFDEVARRSSIPLISIVEATCAAATALKLRKLGLFGTRFVMEGNFYREVFSRAGISLIAPDPEEQTYIHDKYMNELVNGRVVPETRERLLAIVKALRDRVRIDGLILGGTELSLILGGVEDRGIPFLDTTRIHATAVLDRLLAA